MESYQDTALLALLPWLYLQLLHNISVVTHQVWGTKTSLTEVETRKNYTGTTVKNCSYQVWALRYKVGLDTETFNIYNCIYYANYIRYCYKNWKLLRAEST